MAKEETLYTTGQFLRFMVERGHEVGTKPTYLRYERMGVFKPGKFSVAYRTQIHRLFTKEEMLDNEDRYVEYKER